MSLSCFELSLLNSLQPLLRYSILDQSMLIISHITDAGLIWVAVAAACLFAKKTRRLGLTLLAALLLSYYVSDHILKPLIQRPRPFALNQSALLPAAAPSSFSFPSTHACSSFAAATAIALSNRKVGIFAYVFSALVGFSRIYLYLHYPSDIIAGAGLGIVCGWLAATILQRFFPQSPYSPPTPSPPSKRNKARFSSPKCPK
ncbi:MAG: phosphatase PAP2 family protein [Christensenellales bacterium]|jgi:undecaprenyl-diphosphatase